MHAIGVLAAAPQSRAKQFFRAIEQFFRAAANKMKNSILKIINKKYEKYSIGYSKLKYQKCMFNEY